MIGRDLEKYHQLEQLKGIRKTLLGILSYAGNETKHGRWEVLKANLISTTEPLYPEMITANLRGEWEGAKVNVKIFAGASKLWMLLLLAKGKGEIDYPVHVNVVMGAQETDYILKPCLDESKSYRSSGRIFCEEDNFESCLELGQLTELIKTEGLQVVENS